jgi:hypothetical protein
VFAVGMKRHVPRSGAGGDRHKRHSVRNQRSRSEIEVPHIDLVGPQINAEHVIASEVIEDLMRVRPFLAVGIGSGPVADALEIIGHGPDRTVTLDAKNLKVAAGVARRE